MDEVGGALSTAIHGTVLATIGDAFDWVRFALEVPIQIKGVFADAANPSRLGHATVLQRIPGFALAEVAHQVRVLVGVQEHVRVPELVKLVEKRFFVEFGAFSLEPDFPVEIFLFGKTRFANFAFDV